MIFKQIKFALTENMSQFNFILFLNPTSRNKVQLLCLEERKH